MLEVILCLFEYFGCQNISPILGSNSNLTQLFPNCSNNRGLPEIILCMFEYFGCQNIRKATVGRLNVGHKLFFSCLNWVPISNFNHGRAVPTDIFLNKYSIKKNLRGNFNQGRANN